jgi:serine protease Do
LLKALFVAVLALCLSAQADEPPLAAEGTDFLQRLQQACESLVQRVAPAVVAVHADCDPVGPRDDTSAAPLVSFNAGSGIIIRPDGMILTSQHVIDGASAIYLTLYDGRRFRATVVSADRRSDLAVIQIDAAGLPVAELGDARQVRPGHIVFAFGNPLGIAGNGQVAVSQGLISAVGRPLPQTLGRDQDRYYGDMIQTSAPVGPGNSGGPLVDIHGRVIGMVTALGTPGGNDQGLGFAVPIGPDTRAIIDRLLQGRQFDYGYLGVQVGNPTDAQVRAAGLVGHHGALIDSVLPSGPADRVGLRTGDLVVAVDGTRVQSADHFIRLIGSAGPGQKAEIAYVRNTQRQIVSIELARRRSPAEQRPPARTVAFRGATLGEVDSAVQDWSNLSGHALLVLVVSDDSPADRAGLAPGDIIIRVQGKPLTPQTAARLGELSGDVLLGLANGGSALLKPEN